MRFWLSGSTSVPGRKARAAAVTTLDQCGRPHFKIGLTHHLIQNPTTSCDINRSSFFQVSQRRVVEICPYVAYFLNVSYNHISGVLHLFSGSSFGEN